LNTPVGRRAARFGHFVFIVALFLGAGGGCAGSSPARAPADSASTIAAAPLADDASNKPDEALAPARPCTSRDDCPENQFCISPEEQRWNHCGAPRPPACAASHIGDSCGNCFLSCQSDSDCPAGQRCNGSYCISPRRCARISPPPP